MRQISNNAARSPGKLILSGEHSVVYGEPAMVAAVNRYTEVWFTPVHRSRTVQTAFENLSKGEIYPLDMIASIRRKLDERFDAFAQGKLPVQHILQRPDDLAIYTLAQVIQSIPMPGVSSTRRLPVPGRLSSRSDLPLGAGMGSSAAIIAAIIVLYEHFLSKPRDNQKRFEWVRFCERLQHGKGSAVDAAAVIYGGLNRIVGSDISHLEQVDGSTPTLGEGWYWVLSGIPCSTTGECVAAVRRDFSKDAALWRSFGACTMAMEDIILSDADPKAVLKENHRLLQRIGVVTDPVARFIEAVEAAGGAAKISGAGSIKGDGSGMVLVHMDDEEAMKRLMLDWPAWTWDHLALSDHGAHLFNRQMTKVEIDEESPITTGGLTVPGPVR